MAYDFETNPSHMMRDDLLKSGYRLMLKNRSKAERDSICAELFLAMSLVGDGSAHKLLTEVMQGLD